LSLKKKNKKTVDKEILLWLNTVKLKTSLSLKTREKRLIEKKKEMINYN
jgi:hypothetical protein